MRMEKLKGAQGLGKGVALVGTEEKESCDLRSYWLIHGINSILSQDVLTILFLEACIFHSLVIVFSLYSDALQLDASADAENGSSKNVTPACFVYRERGNPLFL